MTPTQNQLNLVPPTDSDLKCSTPTHSLLCNSSSLIVCLSVLLAHRWDRIFWLSFLLRLFQREQMCAILWVALTCIHRFVGGANFGLNHLVGDTGLGSALMKLLHTLPRNF